MSSCSVLDDAPPRRIVRVKALADPALRQRNAEWEKEIRGLVEASSDFFEREFGIRLVTRSVAPWPARERILSTADLLARLKQDFPPGRDRADYDLIIAFSGERMNPYIGGRARVDRIGNCRDGLGSYVVDSVSAPFVYTGAGSEPALDVISLVHELGHIFGAEHTRDSRSIMNENFDYRGDFDMKNRSVVLHNRDCPFAK